MFLFFQRSSPNPTIDDVQSQTVLRSEFVALIDRGGNGAEYMSQNRHNPWAGIYLPSLKSFKVDVLSHS